MKENKKLLVKYLDFEN